MKTFLYALAVLSIYYLICFGIGYSLGFYR